MNDNLRKPGRPAPLGRKQPCSVRLTPDVKAYCREKGYAVLEDAVRRSPEFIAWWDKRTKRD